MTSKLDFNDFMYWLPLILFFIAFMIFQIYIRGIYAFLFYLILGIFLILIILWCKYWLNKNLRLKEK